LADLAQSASCEQPTRKGIEPLSAVGRVVRWRDDAIARAPYKRNAAIFEARDVETAVGKRSKAQPVPTVELQGPNARSAPASELRVTNAADLLNISYMSKQVSAGPEPAIQV
jgi:hypothetical protein